MDASQHMRRRLERSSRSSVDSPVKKSNEGSGSYDEEMCGIISVWRRKKSELWRRKKSCNLMESGMDAVNLGGPRPEIPEKCSMPALQGIRHGLNSSREIREDIWQSVIASDCRRRHHEIVWPTRPSRKVVERSEGKHWRSELAHDTIYFLWVRDWPSWQRRRLGVKYEVPKDYIFKPATQLLDTRITVSAEDCLSCALRLLYENPVSLHLQDLAIFPSC